MSVIRVTRSEERQKVGVFFMSSSFWPRISGKMGRCPPTIVHDWIDQGIPYNFAADSFHTKKLCSRLSSRKVPFRRKNGHFSFWDTLWGWGATYAVHLRLIGKLLVDFPLVIIELFR